MISVDDLLDFADRTLQREGAAEVEFRAAASRAYYAAFHASRTAIAALPRPGRLSATPGGEHESLIQRMERPDTALHGDLQRMSRLLGARMRTLREFRVSADYELNFAITQLDAEKAVLQSKKVVALSGDLSRRLANLGPDAVPDQARGLDPR